MKTAATSPGLVSRVFRALRFLRWLPGWGRIVYFPHPLLRKGEFVIRNGDSWFAGSLASMIDRHLYFLGGYEQALIALFLTSVPRESRRVVLDIGANVGTHSVAFSKHFATVHSFEPNGLLWPAFTRNHELNPAADIRLHRVGLGSKGGKFPFYDLVNDGNHGMGTFLGVEQYSQPLQPAGVATIWRGDDFLDAEGIRDIDAIKIDVQGLESDVLAGLKKTLARYEPLVWMEISAGTQTTVPTFADVQDLFPYRIELWEMVPIRRRLDRRAFLRAAPKTGRLTVGDYLVRPARG